MIRLLKLFCLIGMFFLTSISMAFAGQIKFVQITDVHYKAGSSYKTECLKAFVDEINSQSDVDFVIFTGDNIDNPKENDLMAFIGIVKKLNKPYYVAVGNHDVFRSELSKTRYIEILNHSKIIKKPSSFNYVFKEKGFVFIVVDGAKEVIPGTNGYYKAETLEWLDKQLDKYEKYPVIICQHFPLLVDENSKSHMTYKGDEYLKLLSKHDNVISVVSGHYHSNKEKMIDGVYHIISPSFASDTHSYKIIEIVTTKGFSPMIYTRLKEVSLDKN